MWLINTKTLELCYFNNDDEVDYAILSHRWEEEEVSMQDLRQGRDPGKKGYAKIKQSCAIAVQMNIQYMWIDTCCIDKTSSAELSEAINSMYRWYEQAKICYAYLSDVDTINDLASSKWFTRGWTLQELIAPETVNFFNRNWKSFGTKAGLQGRITSITGIPTRILRGAKPTECSVAQRMSWAAHRVTTRPEDKAYCLMGLFEVNMPMLYGEGMKAFYRLQEEIIKKFDDQSIFAWIGTPSEYSPILAPSPANFQHGAEVRSRSATSDPTPFSLTNVGLSIELPTIPFAMNTYLAILQCQDMIVDRDKMPNTRSGFGTTRIGILIRRTPQNRQFIRYSGSIHQVDTGQYVECLQTVPVLLLQQIGNLGELNDMYGFHFRTMASECFGHRTGYENHDPWSQEEMYRVVCKLSKARLKEINRLSQSCIVEQSDAFQLLRSVKGLDLDLKFGESGTVAAFTLIDKKAERSGSSIALLKVGFDFDFNPVCLFYGMSSKEWTTYCQSDKCYWTDSQSIDKELAKYADMDQSDCWKIYGVCALRGSRASGLDVTLTHLNIHLIIAEEVQYGARKWIVDMSPPEHPFEPYLEAGWDDLKKATWHLYEAERTKHEWEAHVQEETDSYRKSNSQASWAKIQISVQILKDVEKRILTCQSRLYDTQEPLARETREMMPMIIARMAREEVVKRDPIISKLTAEMKEAEGEQIIRKERERREAIIAKITTDLDTAIALDQLKREKREKRTKRKKKEKEPEERKEREEKKKEKEQEKREDQRSLQEEKKNKRSTVSRTWIFT